MGRAGIEPAGVVGEVQFHHVHLVSELVDAEGRHEPYRRVDTPKVPFGNRSAGQATVITPGHVDTVTHGGA